ncbi:unnamed protein product [Paramecium sonneborni]|uniref:Uncharacterized protein n=1 Tax=Paramecium sonneborni TaxID=65129 RepID=A0A8S1LBI2_9CILI|nr:unnamed protein product [Paramecium sonneborni]
MKQISDICKELKVKYLFRMYSKQYQISLCITNKCFNSVFFQGQLSWLICLPFRLISVVKFEAN